jgi:hypothetical protein
VSARRALGPAAVALAVAVGATAALTSGGREVRFTPCPNGAAAACATLPGDGPPVMLVLPGPRPGVAASYEPWADRVVVLRTGAVRTPPECARIALTGFARDPLGERPTVTDCR